MGTRKKPTTTVSRLRVALATLIGVRECLSDALEFANRSIETAREIIKEQTVDEASLPNEVPGPTVPACPVDRSEIITLISQLRDMHRTWSWIADEFNKGSYRTPRGHKWRATTLQQFYLRHKATDGRTEAGEKG